MDLLKIKFLPEDLVGEILSFLPSKTLKLCDKNNWSEDYKKRILMNNMKASSYWRFLLRYDNNFVFNEYLIYNFTYFIKNKKIIYQDKIFPRKVELVKYLSTFVFDSQKCKVILEKFMRKDRLVFKKIKTKIRKWTN
jgi:hypothetical protein|tara:strand:- start:203 stop:613 length:411 start_codon:yes stop_codon:yes gene_type:complete